MEITAVKTAPVKITLHVRWMMVIAHVPQAGRGGRVVYLVPPAFMEKTAKFIASAAMEEHVTLLWELVHACPDFMEITVKKSASQENMAWAVT